MAGGRGARKVGDRLVLDGHGAGLDFGGDVAEAGAEDDSRAGRFAELLANRRRAAASIWAKSSSMVALL
jgi:hypothetical protein